MAQVIWTEPALNDLDAIADYIAVENVVAAAALVQRVFGRMDQLEVHPESGPHVPELKRSRYQQIAEPPCRVFYRFDGRKIFILHVMRSEQLLRRALLEARDLERGL